MTKDQVCVIIGMGHAAAQFIPALRRGGWEGKIIWFGNEGFLPYQRPPLSKEFLRSEDDQPTFIKAEILYSKLEIECHVDQSVISINKTEQFVILADQSKVFYDKLVIATGGSLRKMDIPGSGLKNIHYLRSYQDAVNIKRSITDVKEAVVIGGGYIGLEMAASLRSKDIDVTLLEAEDRILSRVTSPEMSYFINRIHLENKVKVLCNKKVVRFEGEEIIKKVVCEDGSSFDADLVVIGIGINPDVSLAESANISINNGILVDEYSITDNPNIYAIGDCSNHNSILYNKRLRIESVPNAMEQANAAAAHICGIEKPYTAVPWFWSNQFDMKLQIAGISDDYDEIAIRGDLERGNNIVIWYLKNKEIIAADCVNSPKEFITAKQLIAKKAIVDPDALSDPAIEPKELINHIARTE